MFWRLTTVADDFGRVEAEPDVLLCACFPKLLDRVKLTHIKDWLSELVTCDLLTAYVSGSRTYAFFNTWDRHQRTRAKHSKYPAPTPDNICQQVLSNASGGKGYGIEGKESRVWGKGYGIEDKEGDGESPPMSAPNGTNAWGTPETLMAFWNEHRPEHCSRVTSLTGRREAYRTALRDFPDRDWWDQVLQKARASKLLSGQVPPKTPGDKPWKATLDWLVDRQKKHGGVLNALRVYEGQYDEAQFGETSPLGRAGHATQQAGARLLQKVRDEGRPV